MTERPRPDRTPLEDRLAQLIKLKGPITVADYMEDALGHPHDGYYTSRPPFGTEGDFTTAPEVSQIFGELIGLWLLEAWRAMGSPASFNLVELGPGRGTLMDDILRATRLRPDFTRGAELWLVETSGRLRLEQQKRLKGRELAPRWVDRFADIPPAPSLIVANEFFDCLPIRQFERGSRGWRERLIGVNDEDSLDFVLGQTPPPADYNLPGEDASEPGDIFEIGFAARDFAGETAAFLRDHGGAALIFDYGHFGAGVGDTLQAVRGHAFWPPLWSPGQADLTAHVNFAALADAAIDAGAAVYGPTAQGRFLERLGLALRTEMLCKDKPAAEQETIRAGARRISAADEMGEIFKALCIASPEAPMPAGFADL